MENYICLYVVQFIVYGVVLCQCLYDLETIKFKLVNSPKIPSQRFEVIKFLFRNIPASSLKSAYGKKSSFLIAKK